MSSTSFEVVGHRGGGEGPDENTLASCRRGIALGADRIELDVQLINDELMLAHPPRKPKESLATVLEGIGDTPLMLHLKRRRFNPWHDRKAIRRMAPLLAGRNTVIITLWPGTAAYLRRYYPKLRYAFVSAWAWYDLHFWKRLSTKEWVSRSWMLSARMMRLANKHGAKITVYTTNNTPKMAAKLKRLGVTGVMTDDVAFWKQQ